MIRTSLINLLVLCASVITVASDASAEVLCRRVSVEGSYNSSNDIFIPYELVNVQVDDSAKTVAIKTQYQMIKNHIQVLKPSILDRMWLKLAHGKNLSEVFQIGEEQFIGDSRVLSLIDSEGRNAGRFVIAQGETSTLEIDVNDKETRYYYQGVGACPQLVKK